MSKTALILFNLGGPDSKESIRPFLMNFFMDPNIIALPAPFRWLIAKYISVKRSKNEAGDSYGALGNKSPLLENSKAQARALEKVLGKDFKVFICMRYWHPMADEVAREVKDWGAEEIVLLPLYPQFSTTTTWSSLGVWKRAAKKIGLAAPVKMACCYPRNEGFVKASVENIRAAIAKAREEGHESPRLLFSAHGLPEKIIEGGDPYQWQCEETMKAILSELDENLETVICYQSRVGPMAWIGPSTEHEIVRAGAEKKALVIYPHSFTQEHVETLVELDIEYHEIAHAAGVPGYYRAATVSTHPDFIEGLAKLVRESTRGIHGENNKKICPENFTRCCMRAGNL